MSYLEEREREYKKQIERERQERRDEFRRSGKGIPDLEFFPPDCSICGGYTSYDDGVFSCDGCEVYWPQSGYGHEARTYDEEYRL